MAGVPAIKKSPAWQKAHASRNPGTKPSAQIIRFPQPFVAKPSYFDGPGMAEDDYLSGPVCTSPWKP